MRMAKYQKLRHDAACCSTRFLGALVGFLKHAACCGTIRLPLYTGTLASASLGSVAQSGCSALCCQHHLLQELHTGRTDLQLFKRYPRL